jgi:hypothetical protein
MSLDRARRYLQEEVDRADLALLLKYAEYFLREDRDMAHYPDFFATTITLVVRAPSPVDEALRGLGDLDRTRIVGAIKQADVDVASSVHSEAFQIELDRGRELAPSERLLADVIVHRNGMLAVGTGGARIEEVDDLYKARQKRIGKQLAAEAIPYSNTYASLWDWFKDPNGWTRNSYASRRAVVGGIFDPVIEALCAVPESDPVPAREPSGWNKVDRAVEKARASLSASKHAEDYQTIGSLCRDLLISLGQAVFDPNAHKHPDNLQVGPADAKRMLEAYIASERGGDSNEELRAQVRTTYKLAAALSHKRTPDFRSAALCLEATSSAVSIIAIIAGRRDPS